MADQFSFSHPLQSRTSVQAFSRIALAYDGRFWIGVLLLIVAMPSSCPESQTRVVDSRKRDELTFARLTISDSPSVLQTSLQARTRKVSDFALENREAVKRVLQGPS